MNDERRCKTCKQPTTNGMKECENCWEVEGRLERYLRSEKGRRFVRAALFEWSDQWSPR